MISDRHVYLINVTADQPLSENSRARGGVGGGLMVIRCSNTNAKNCKLLVLLTPYVNDIGYCYGNHILESVLYKAMILYKFLGTAKMT